MKTIALYVTSLIAALSNAPCFATDSLLAVYQIPEYPLPGKPYANPPGLFFEVCADGSVYRASQGGGVRGQLETSILHSFQENLEEEWLGSLRAECKAHGITPDGARQKIKPASGVEFECSVYNKGDALTQFEARIAGLRLSDTVSVDTNPSKFCK